MKKTGYERLYENLFGEEYGKNIIPPENYKAIMKTLKKLPPKEYAVVTLLYNLDCGPKDYNYEELAEVMKISSDKVHMYELRLLDKLRRPPYVMPLLTLRMDRNEIERKLREIESQTRFYKSLLKTIHDTQPE